MTTKPTVASTAVFIDLDGTILDVSDRLYAIYTQCLQSIRTRPLTKDEYWTLRRSGESELDIFLRTGKPELAHRFTRTRASRLEHARFLALDAPFPGVKECLDRLKRASAVHLITLRQAPRNLKSQLLHHGLAAAFDRVILAAGQPQGTPWEKKASAIVASLGTLPDRGIVVGDTQADILCGKILGFETIAVTSGLFDEGALRRWQPDQVFPRLSEAVHFLLDRFQPEGVAR